jgi:hypothetical protein
MPPMVPHGCRDYAAGPNDATHLTDRLAGFGDEVEHQQRQRAVERIALERQSAGVRLLNSYSWIGVAPDRFLDEDRRIVDCGNFIEISGPRERERQAAGAAADVENLFAVGDPREVDEQRCEPLTPAAHQLLIA